MKIQKANLPFKMIHQAVKRRNNIVNYEDDEEVSFDCKNYVGHYGQTAVVQAHRFFLNRSIGELHLYEELIQTLLTASENDHVQLFIDNHGGNFDTACSIVSAIRNSQATVQAVIGSRCSSAASVIALQCHEVEVLPLAGMLIHCASYGSSGKEPDVYGYVVHSNKTLRNAMKEFYEGFLTTEELDKVLDGKEMFLTEEEIKDRLEERQKYFEELEEEKKKQMEYELAESSKFSKKELDKVKKKK